MACMRTPEITRSHFYSFTRVSDSENAPAWVRGFGYGSRDSENENLPGFISLNAAKPSVYSSEFLPTEFAGTPIGTNGEDMSLATIRDISGPIFRRV